jgi:hypothetical protein
MQRGGLMDVPRDVTVLDLNCQSPYLVENVNPRSPFRVARSQVALYERQAIKHQ